MATPGTPHPEPSPPAQPGLLARIGSPFSGLSIGRRLVLCFAILLVLMVAVDSVVLWQFAAV